MYPRSAIVFEVTSSIMIYEDEATKAVIRP